MSKYKKSLIPFFSIFAGMAALASGASASSPTAATKRESDITDPTIVAGPPEHFALAIANDNQMSGTQHLGAGGTLLRRIRPHGADTADPAFDFSRLAVA